MKSDFLIAITQLSAEKNLPKEVVLEVVEAALVSAYKKDSFAPNQNVSVKIHPTTGDVNVYVQKTVVQEVSDPRTEIALIDATRIQPNAKVGDVVEVESTPQHAGRIAAQTAKQVVLQRLREAEREAVFEEFVNKEGDIVSGYVQRIEPRQLVLDLGKAEAILPTTEQVSGERYRVGQRLKAFLLEVNRTNKGPQVVVSRTHRNLIRRLFEMEVPEIYNGVVEIKAIAREPGFRTKVAVAANQAGVDPVGSCVGLRGIRIQNIVNELSGERIDVIEWNADPAVFVAHALSPAQVVSVDIYEDEKRAEVVVPDRQLSLAIGKEGQNARLAAKLTGWKVDIKNVSAAEAEKAQRVAAQEEAALASQEVPATSASEVVAEVTPVVTEEIAPVKEPATPVAAEISIEIPELIEVPETPAPVVEPGLLPSLVEIPLEPVPTLEHGRIRFAEDLVAVPGRGEVSRDRSKSKRGTHDEKDVESAAKRKKARRPRFEVEEEYGDYNSEGL